MQVLLNCLVVVMAVVVVPSDAVEWNFAKCVNLPTTNTCAKFAQKVVETATPPSAIRTDSNGWKNYHDCATKTEIKDERILDFGANIENGLPKVTDLDCRQYYSHKSSKVTKDTRTGGYKNAGDVCYEAKNIYKCFSGHSGRKICGVKADLVFKDAKQKAVTEYDGQKIPKQVDWETIPCRSVCLRYAHSCCEGGFIGRSRDLSDMKGRGCKPGDTGRSVMTYYDMSWVYQHMNSCEGHPVAHYTKTIPIHGGFASLKARCYDPKCDRKDTADKFCKPEQLLEQSNEESKKPASHSFLNNPSSGLMIMLSISFMLLL